MIILQASIVLRKSVSMGVYCNVWAMMGLGLSLLARKDSTVFPNTVTCYTLRTRSLLFMQLELLVLKQILSSAIPTPALSVYCGPKARLGIRLLHTS